MKTRTKKLATSKSRRTATERIDAHEKELIALQRAYMMGSHVLPVVIEMAHQGNTTAKKILRIAAEQYDHAASIAAIKKFLGGL